MENLLSMPISPFEIMLGKIVPYILVGFVQAALIISIGVTLFKVPIVGNLAVLAALSTLFIATNLSIGYTFSTIAQNQLQAMQMSMMFFLPNILLSGFLFPFAGMPALGAICRRGAAAHAFFACHTSGYAQGLEFVRLAIRRNCNVRADADCDDDRHYTLPADARLAQYLFRRFSRK